MKLGMPWGRDAIFRKSYQGVPFRTRSEELDDGSKTELAQALAHGISAAKWAKSRNVPRNTAYRWAREPAVRKDVEAIRRRTIDLAVGRMTRHTTRAAEGIVTLADGAESESVRLRAYRAIFSDMISVSHYSGLDDRLTDLERRLDDRDAEMKSPSPFRTGVNHGNGTGT
jgi:hypothetical protein